MRQMHRCTPPSRPARWGLQTHSQLPRHFLAANLSLGPRLPCPASPAAALNPPIYTLLCNTFAPNHSREPPAASTGKSPWVGVTHFRYPTARIPSHTTPGSAPGEQLLQHEQKKLPHLPISAVAGSTTSERRGVRSPTCYKCASRMEACAALRHSECIS